jgi:hypothetical protein
MNKSHKQRYMELVGLTENADKKQLSNERFQQLSELYIGGDSNIINVGDFVHHKHPLNGEFEVIEIDGNEAIIRDRDGGEESARLQDLSLAKAMNEMDENKNSKQGEKMKVEKFEQKSFEERPEDAELYDLTNETFEVELDDNLLSEAYEQFKRDASDDLEDALLNNYQDISADQIRGFVREFIEFLDTSESINKG